MTEKDKIQKIMNLTMGMDNNYEDAFSILFELALDPKFMEKGNAGLVEKLSEIKNILQSIASVQTQICIIEKWELKEVKPQELNAYYHKAYNMYHVSIVFSNMVFIGIVFPGIKRGLVQGNHSSSKRVSYSKFILKSKGDQVN